MPNVKTGKRRDKMVILEFVLNELNDKIVNSDHLLPLNPRGKREKGKRMTVGFKMCFERENNRLLSRIVGDPTVGSRRSKKESCSTQRDLPMSPRFEEFRQNPWGRGFSLLGFYSLFKYFVNV